MRGDFQAQTSVICVLRSTSPEHRTRNPRQARQSERNAKFQYCTEQDASINVFSASPALRPHNHMLVSSLVGQFAILAHGRATSGDG